MTLPVHMSFHNMAEAYPLFVEIRALILCQKTIHGLDAAGVDQLVKLTEEVVNGYEAMIRAWEGYELG